MLYSCTYVGAVGVKGLKGTKQHSDTPLTSFHLPDVDGAVRAADDDKVIVRSPLDDVYRKQLT